MTFLLISNYIFCVNDNFELNNYYLEDLRIMEAYYINLPESTKRREHMEKLSKNINFPFTRFEAFSGKVLEESLRENKPIPRLHKDVKLNYQKCKQKVDSKELGWHPNIGWNHLGSWQSHLGVYFEIVEKAKTSRFDAEVLILEDDVVFHRWFKPYFLKIRSVLPDDWDILALGSCNSQCQGKIIWVNPDVDLCLAKNFSCTHAYMIRNSYVAQKLILYTNTEEPQLIDDVWNPHLGTDLKVYLVDNIISWDGKIPSDTNNIPEGNPQYWPETTHLFKEEL